jgi:hypothetical protein
MRKILFICFFVPALSLVSQFKFQGIGIFGALTQSAHYYKNLDTDKKGIDTAYRVYYPQTHISKEFFSWGAGLFIELGGPRTRWQTELEYANKGAKERELINAYTGDREEAFRPNKFRHIQWNNYLKFYYPLGAGHWYLMPGIRLEYLLGSTPSVFVPVSSQFPKFWFSGDVGIGYEIPLVRRISIFIEGHWNPDIISHTHDNTKVRNRTFEYRVGLVRRPKKRSVDDCNAPVYRGPVY